MLIAQLVQALVVITHFGLRTATITLQVDYIAHNTFNTKTYLRRSYLRWRLGHRFYLLEQNFKQRRLILRGCDWHRC
ncbi:hypothetical protein O9993_08095 [Vibrio lentus]|nr:hypothetical protein [Vibrio lentus]